MTAEILAFKKSPVTFGYEIEQKDEDICNYIGNLYDWSYDAGINTPLETQIFGGKSPGAKVKEFIDHCRKAPGCTWEWKSELYKPMRRISPYVGCGSHIHLRPNEDVDYIREDLATAWTVTHNTLIEVVPLLAPMFAWGRDNKFVFRKELFHWSSFIFKRLSPASIREYLHEDYRGHPYFAVAMNRTYKEKPLTIELRLNETHIGISYATTILLSRIIRACFERGKISPKLDKRSLTLGKIHGAIRTSTDTSRDLYDYLDHPGFDVGPIEFLPGRGIPGVKKQHETWGNLFDSILTAYRTSNPPVARVFNLFKHRGKPFKNWKACWNLFVPRKEFKWDEDIPSK